MDQTQLQDKIVEYFNKLPADAQALFSSMSWMEKLKGMSAKYSLTPEQIEVLGTETTLVLLGIVHPDEYENTLRKEVKIPNDMLEKMLVEINDSIISTIRPQLSETYESNIESAVGEKYGNIQNLDERFSKLPKQVQDAITESDYQTTLYNIGTEQKLSIAQMGDLEEVTNKVLLGIIHPDKYEGELTSKLGIPTEKITALVTSVNDKILKNIREILKSHSDVGSEISNIDDEVPLPPYAEKKAVLEEAPKFVPAPLPKIEEKIYENAGIEVIENVSPKDDMSQSIIGSKLSSATISKPTVSDHSLPKITPEIATKVHDPYHEPIE